MTTAIDGTQYSAYSDLLKTKFHLTQSVFSIRVNKDIIAPILLLIAQVFHGLSSVCS